MAMVSFYFLGVAVLVGMVARLAYDEFNQRR